VVAWVYGQINGVALLAAVWACVIGDGIAKKVARANEWRP